MIDTHSELIARAVPYYIAGGQVSPYIRTMNHEPWEILENELIYDAGWMKIRRERCRTNANEIIDPYFIFDFPAWVMAIAITAENKIVILEHYRHGLRQVGWEFPSGLAHPNEAPLEGAQRELLEETGYAGRRCQLLGRLAPNPALQSNFMSIVMISDASRVADPVLEPGEELCVHTKSVDDVSRMIADGSMYHALNVAAFSLAVARNAFRND